MLDALLSFGGKLIGGALDKRNADKNRAAEMAMAQENLRQQERFAKEGLRWKVQDAKEAGIHPAFALGAQTASFSPISIGGGSDSNWSGTLGSMGQDLGRAINSTRTEEERLGAFETSVRKLELEGKQLDNDIKRASLASAVQKNKQGVGPPFPVATPENDLMMGGRRIHSDPNWSDTQHATNRHGESADWWYGPMVTYADWAYNAGPAIRRGWPDTVKKFGRYMDYISGKDSFKSRFHY